MITSIGDAGIREIYIIPIIFGLQVVVHIHDMVGIVFGLRII